MKINKIDELKKLKNLLDEGAINEDEFIFLKNQIISNQKESNTSENSIKEGFLPQPEINYVPDNTIDVNIKETTINKSHYNDWQEGNHATGLLFKCGILLSIIAGLAFWEKYNFASFIVLSGISITGIVLLNKVNKVMNRNLYLGLICVGLVFLGVFSLGSHYDFSFNTTNNSTSQEDNSIQEQEDKSIPEKKEEKICNYCNGTGTQVCGLCGGSGENISALSTLDITIYNKKVNISVGAFNVIITTWKYLIKNYKNKSV